MAALVIAVLPLVAWSGGCSSNVTTPDGGHGGSGATGGAAGASGTGGGAGTASGGEGGSDSSDGGLQCCPDFSSPSRRCTDDRRQLRVCERGPGCGPSATYSMVMKLMDCPNGCFPSDAATTNDDCPQ